jgi:hypothetical protein
VLKITNIPAATAAAALTIVERSTRISAIAIMACVWATAVTIALTTARIRVRRWAGRDTAR